MEHILRWERIAVITNVDWIRHTIQAFSFMIPGAVRISPLNEQAKAREWIVGGAASTSGNAYQRGKTHKTESLQLRLQAKNFSAGCRASVGMPCQCPR